MHLMSVSCLHLLPSQVIGVGASVIGDMSSRPNWGLNELDFVFATLVVGSIMNFSLMYLLAPTGATAAAAGQSFLSKALGDTFLKGWGAPGKVLFQYLDRSCSDSLAQSQHLFYSISVSLLKQ